MLKRRASVLLSVALAACGGQNLLDDQPGEAAEAQPHRAPHADAVPVAQELPPPITATKDGELVDASGRAVHLHGFSWFGLNTQGHLGGLWSTDPLAGDFATIVHRQKALGFNAVRVPFSFSLFKQAAQTPTFGCQPLDAAAIAAATVDPQDPGVTSPLPPLLRDADRASGRCNGYLPTSSVRDLFIWTVKFYVDNGFYVLADNHLREDRTALDDFQAYVEGWKDVVRELEAYPPAHGRVLLDLLNEPGEKGVDWNHLGPMYITVMDALWGESKHFPFLLEGTGQESIGANWGDGFATDGSKVSNTGNPLPFFNTLASKAYADWVVLGPHCYGPAVTNATERYQGKELFDRLDLSFGTHNSKGMQVTARTLRPPVAIGEFGSKFEDERDKAFMRDFASYLRRTEGAAGEGLKSIGNWFYWDWNANSGDTGGLVTDDWKTLQWEKLRYLRGLGLKPWYLSDAPSAAAPVAAPSTPSSTSPPSGPTTASSNAPTASAAPSTAPTSPPAPATDAPRAAPEAGPSAPRAGPASHPVDVPKEGSGCHVRVAMDSTWKAENQTFATLNLFFTMADDATTKVPFGVEVRGKSWRQVVQAWNVEGAKLDGGVLKGTVKADWATILPGGHNVVNIGFIVSGEGDDLTPTEVNVNGATCALDHAAAKT